MVPTLPVAARAKKLLQNRVLRGLEMRRFSQNKVYHGNLYYYVKIRNSKISQIFNFNWNTPTQIHANYAFSNLDQKFWIRIPRDLNQDFDIPRISKSYWFIFTFLKVKIRLSRKVTGVCNPGIQPTNKSPWQA